jgi:hypothetical protein
MGLASIDIGWACWGVGGFIGAWTWPATNTDPSFMSASCGLEIP